MNTSSPHNQSPISLALGNAVWAVIICAGINLLCCGGVDLVNRWVGNPPTQKAPTWIGTLIIGGQTGWAVLALAILCGLLGRDMSGLTLILIATYFLGLISPIAGLLVGAALVYSKNDNDLTES